MTALSLRTAVRNAAAVFAGCYGAVTRRMRRTQPMLDRKRLYWDGHRCRAGPREGAGPYRAPGPGLPTFDYRGRLPTDPARLAQQLSTQGDAG